MRKLIQIILLAGILAAGTAHADLTIQQTMKSSGGMASLADGATTTYLKGNKMRVDQGDTSTIMDLDNKVMITLDHKKQRAERMDMSEMAEAQQSIGGTSMSVTMEPNGKSKELLGYETEGYDMTMIFDFKPAGMPENMPFKMDFKMKMTGEAYMADDAPGADEFAGFYQQMFDSGMFFGPPEAAEAQPDMVRGQTKIFETMAEAGMPLQSTITSKMEASGPMAAMAKNMSSTSTTTVKSISNDDLDASLFEIPAGYKIK